MSEKAYESHVEEGPWKLRSVKLKPPPRNSLKNHFSLGDFFFFWVLLVGILEMFVIRFEIPLLLGLFPLLLGFGAFGKTTLNYFPMYNFSLDFSMI